ncbi:MAG: hypothetical protein H7Y07_08830 [Pyrinomonadaceae bacterium]|nr:hypothetical protein [Sphingobacteriaceae bacterium]
MKLREKILNFEHWIASDFKLDEPKIFQRELLTLFYENQEAFSYYRNWLYTLLLHKGEQAILKQFYEILDLKIETENHKLLSNHYLENNAAEIFSQKRQNTFEIAIQSPNSVLNHSTCFLYQQYYEIEILFLVLSSFIRLNETDTIETDFANFKDRNGSLKKGVLIDNLKSKLKSFPLILKLFELGYNSKVRNTIGHNNYRIEGANIVSLDGNITLSKEEVFEAIYSMQNLNNCLLNYFSNKSISTDKLQNAGMLGVAFGLDEMRPVLSIFQLSCFFELGDFQWPNKIIFSVNKNQLETDFGFQVPMIGSFTKELEQSWFNPLKEIEKLKAYLIPIIPRNDESEYITLDVGDFVVIGDGKLFEIEYEINNYGL